ncbi:MAG TPA: methyltransferase domain-containing protein [Pirellulales bacterium]|nr:methyltransferase domain-containing protein [Pirellulales bacterium]
MVSQRRRRLRVILLWAAVPFLLMLAVYLYSVTDAGLDTSPLPRAEVNAPFIRTPEEIVDQMLALADPKPDELLYDLGCGDGRIVIAAARRYGCRAVGFDIDPQRVEEARANVRRSGLEKQVTIVEQDIFTLDLRPADVVTLYLLPRLNARLLPQLKGLRPGARIVSHDFDLPKIKPDRELIVIEKPRDVEHTIYLWMAPLPDRF